ncbi:hypothetical protein [Chryseobacterium sp.]|uniref:hypothetical protein n=1 Tax=Chryseobacterium sp. TaxID=1871047 RepID=UPI0028987881|nr:hypothetical protein [Chryseobacterium sp.]
MTKQIIPLLFILSVISCEKEVNSEAKSFENKTENNIVSKTVQDKEILYSKFKPDTISDVKIKGFDIESSFSYGSKKFTVGSYISSTGEITAADTENDYGKRLLVLNEKDKIIFKGRGSGDSFQYWPKFYRNKSNEKVIIVCQMAFEYFYGGEVFLLENNSVKYLGTIDLEPFDEETKMTDILEIYEKNNAIHFKFNSDTLLLQPGSEDIKIKNNGIEYVYEDSKFTLNR